MRKSLILTEHLTISSVVLLILFSLVFLSFSVVKNILINPYRYFSTDFSVTEIQFAFVYISLIVVCVLVSFIIYLLLSLRTRAELMVLGATRSIAGPLEQFTKLYEEAPIPYITLNEAGEIHNPNKAALRFFGALSRDIEGKNIFSFQPEEDREKAEKLFRYYKAKVPINGEEIRMVTKAGAVKWVLISVFETKSLESVAYTGLATIFDITEQKKLDQAKTEFVSLASHQLRTPVATVKWLTDILLTVNAEALSDKQKDYINRIHKVNEGMVDLIDTLLNVSRTEIGSLMIEPKPTNVIEVAESILVELSSQIEEKKLNIIKQYDDNLQNIESDPKLLRIVIQNIISNAVKYTLEEGSITIAFKDSFGEKAIIVSDTGVGIPASQQDKVFTKLFRADNVRSLEGSQGTGLGLYLVKSIMEAMGGSLSFVSEENKGSTFTIRL